MLRSGLFLIAFAAGCAGAPAPVPTSAPGAPPPDAPAPPSAPVQGRPTASDAAAPVEPAATTPDTAAPVVDGLAEVTAFRRFLEEGSVDDPAARAALRGIPAIPARVGLDEERMLAVIDVLVRHAVPYVWEYVYDSYDDTVPDRLRLPVELVTMPGIAGDAARRGAGRVLRTYLPLTTSDVVHRQMRLEEVRASLSDDDGERAAQAQVHLDAAIAMNAYLRETLVPLLDPGRELELGEVLDAVRQLVEVARRNDFEGTDTADRARADGIAMLRLLSTGRREELHLATLRVSRLRGHGARIAP